MEKTLNMISAMSMFNANSRKTWSWLLGGFLSAVLIFCLAVPANATSTKAGVHFDNPYYSHGSGGYGTNYASESHSSPGGSFALVTADAAKGALGAGASGVPGDNVHAWGSVEDNFTLHGLPWGTPVTLTADFYLDGSLSGNPNAAGTSPQNARVLAQFSTSGLSGTTSILI